jgi:hypothetical protein
MKQADRHAPHTCEGVSKSFRTGRLEQKLQMVQLSATRCSCIAILWVSLVSFAAITLCVASQQVFIAVSICFVMTQSGIFWIHPRIVRSFYAFRTSNTKEYTSIFNKNSLSPFSCSIWPSIALDYRLNDCGFKSRKRVRIFLFTAAFRQALGHTQPTIQGLFPWG